MSYVPNAHANGFGKKSYITVTRNVPCVTVILGACILTIAASFLVNIIRYSRTVRLQWRIQKINLYGT